MRIKTVTVKNLFGMFNHEIPLNMQNHMTIIHGPNGIGKTVLLTMLNALFSSRYHELRQIPYSELSIDFDDSSNLRLKKTIQPEVEGKNRGDDVFKLVLEFSKNGSKSNYTIPSISRDEIPFPIGVIEHEIPKLERIGSESWIYLPTQEKLSLDGILDRFGDRLPIDRSFIRKMKNEPPWLKEIRESIHISFIQTQRLLNFSYPRRMREYEGRPSMVPTVINYSEELANAIQAKLAEYGSLSQSLDITFPSRLVKRSISSELTIEELKTKSLMN
jgi:energy-coupling factor transporter ATP-binding protein EcfA2